MPTHDGVLPLFAAASENFVEIAKMMLEHPASKFVHKCNLYGNVHTCSVRTYLRFVCYRESGADQANATGITPLSEFHNPDPAQS